MNVETKILPGHVHPHAVIHPAAHVQVGCTIGARTRVWQFASVIRKAGIGEDCRIAAGAMVDGSIVGHRSIISHAAFIDPGMVIGNDVFIGPFVAMCNDVWPRTDKAGFDMEALISGEIVTTRIDDGASVGAGAILMPGVVIGRMAMVAAGAVVTGNVPDHCLYHRDGRIVEIDERREVTRMRMAGA